MKRNVIALLSLVFLFAFSSCSPSPFVDVDTSRITSTASQEANNYTNVSFDISGLDRIDKIKVTSTISYDGSVTYSKAQSFIINPKKTSTFLSQDVGNFGKFNATIEYYSQNVVVKTDQLDVGVSADEYNLAALNGTFPVLYFSLSLWDMKEDLGNPIPTFAFFERGGAYNWNMLPKNVYALPTASFQHITESNSTQDNYFHEFRPQMVQYIADLHELNPDAKFNLYCSDFYPEFILDMLIANGIQDEDYTVTLLSDGTGTYNAFNSTFNIADPETLYETMKQEWNQMKQAARNGEPDYLDFATQTSGSSFQILEKYSYVIANEQDNVEYWLARKGSLYSQDSAFLDKVNASPSVIEKNVKTMLDSLKSKGAKVENDLKHLYSFSDDMFSNAVNAQKDVMLILGTRTVYEYNFSDYVNFAKTHYGDEYVYYYKGHPGTPTGLDSTKIDLLEGLGLIDVESSIAAELILFFYPDIYLCGYASGTLMSVEEDKMATVLFNKTEASADSAYKSKMDMFISSNGDGKYLVQFNDPAKDDQIWDPDTLSFI